MLYGVVEFGKPETEPEDLRRQLVQMLLTENGDGRFVVRPTMEATAQDVVRNFLANPGDCRHFLLIWAYCLSVSDIDQNTYATDLQESLLSCSRTVPSHYEEASAEIVMLAWGLYMYRISTVS